MSTHRIILLAVGAFAFALFVQVTILLGTAGGWIDVDAAEPYEPFMRLAFTIVADRDDGAAEIVAALAGIYAGVCTYSAATGALVGYALAAFRVTRAQLRIRSNRCWHCGYSLVGLDTSTCPECASGRQITFR